MRYRAPRCAYERGVKEDVEIGLASTYEGRSENVGAVRGQ